MNLKLITTEKRFAGFFWTQFIGAFTDNFFKNALVVLVAFRGVQIAGLKAEDLVAAASGLFILPFFLFSPLAGQISDRFEKSGIVRLIKKLEIVVMLVAALGFFLQSYVLLLGVLFLMGTQAAFLGPIKFSMIPELVKEEDLTAGNAFVELGTFVAILIGTVGGGLITTVPHADTYIGAILVAFAVFGYLTSRAIPESRIAAPDLRVRFNPLPELTNLYRISREKTVVFNSLLGISWFWFYGAGILSILPIYVKDYLGADERVVTLFLTMFTVGIGIGSILCEKLSFKRVEIGLVPIGSLGMTVFILDLFFLGAAWPEHSWRMMADFLLMSVFGGIYIVPLYTLLQERSPEDKRSRVIAANNILNAIFMVGASVLVLVFYRLNLNTAQIFAVFAAMNVAVAVYIYGIVPEFTLRFYSWVLSRIMYRVRVEGLEHIPREGACMLACNHVTFIDWLILYGACKRPARFVMYYKFFEIPLVKIFFKHAKVIPIASGFEDEQILRRAYERIEQELKEGEVVFIFPEGKLTTDGKLSPFKPGIEKMAKAHGCPVVPVTLKGLWGSVFSKKPQGLPHRRRVDVNIFPAIPADKFNVRDLENLVARELGETPPSARGASQKIISRFRG